MLLRGAALPSEPQSHFVPQEAIRDSVSPICGWLRFSGARRLLTDLERWKPGPYCLLAFPCSAPATQRFHAACAVRFVRISAIAWGICGVTGEQRAPRAGVLHRATLRGPSAEEPESQKIPPNERHVQMAKAKKKTAAQVVVGLAASGMPAQVKALATQRWVALLLVLVAALAVGTGVLTVQWTDGRPKLRIDRERAAEVKQNIKERIEVAKERLGDNDKDKDARRFFPFK